MPNCDFYAVPSDHEPLLDWLFAERTCEVYELGSEFEQPLRRFESTSRVMELFDQYATVHLQLYVIGAGPPFVPKRIRLNPEACGGATFRYAAEGWGLIQLYLSSAKPTRLEVSHTNHNSLKRATAWAPTIQDLASPEAWDFARIISFSSRLNRTIKKQGVAKIGSRVILPGALSLWESGLSLGPYNLGEHDKYFKKRPNRMQ
ncbi:MAG: hypothetical protein JWM68_2664 [Verrucomicrobiales bacterium]|nr:hypothetical protein [Verrucomicrobiales bacterium]